MKKQLMVLSVLAFGLQGVAHAAYPADAEATFSLLTLESSQSWGVSKRAVEPHNPFPFGGGYIDD